MLWAPSSSAIWSSSDLSSTRLLPLHYYEVTIFKNEETSGRHCIDFYPGADAGITGISCTIARIFRAWG
ncbi:hypothetical protein ES703_97688 [subsurface metagenome]